MAMSVERAERIGPTSGMSWEWKMAASRVMPPSTPSSTMTSAWLMPSWGRPFGALSIFTISAGRATLAGSVIASPVSGAPAAGVAPAAPSWSGAVVVVPRCGLLVVAPPHAAVTEGGGHERRPRRAGVAGRATS